MLRWKGKVWKIAAIVLLVLGLILLGMFRFELDVAMALWALVGLVVAVGIYMLISHLIAPSKRVEIVTRVELIAPPRLLRNIKNYRLKVSTVKHIEEKGKERTVHMDELNLSFNQQDHPNAYDYCLSVVSKHMEENLALARRSHPDATVEASEISLPPSLKQIGP